MGNENEKSAQGEVAATINHPRFTTAKLAG